MPVAFPLAVAAAALLSAGCQTTPAPGSDMHAKVSAVPLTRLALDHGAGFGKLHTAMRSGASAADAAAKRVVLAEALFAGTSSGANVVAAIDVARRLGSGAQVVTLMVGSGLKYVSTGVFRGR